MNICQTVFLGGLSFALPSINHFQSIKVMETNSYSTSIVVNKSADVSLKAIKDFRGWWSEGIEGVTDQVGGVFFYHHKDIHLCKVKLMEEVPGKRLVYQVLDNQFSFIKDKTEWVDTKLIFDLVQEGDQTKIVFTHEGLVPTDECYKVCYDGWSFYINKSLFEFINTGKGEPNPKDREGFNDRLDAKWKLK